MDHKFHDLHKKLCEQGKKEDLPLADNDQDLIGTIMKKCALSIKNQNFQDEKNEFEQREEKEMTPDKEENMLQIKQFPYYAIAKEFLMLAAVGIPSEAIQRWFREHFTNEADVAKFRKTVDAAIFDAERSIVDRFDRAAKLLYYRCSEFATLPKASEFYQDIGLDAHHLDTTKTSFFHLCLAADEIAQAIQLARHNAAVLLTNIAYEAYKFLHQESERKKNPPAQVPPPPAQVPPPPAGSTVGGGAQQQNKDTPKTLGVSHRKEALDLLIRAFTIGDVVQRSNDLIAEILVLGPISLCDRMVDPIDNEPKFLEKERPPREYIPIPYDPVPSVSIRCEDQYDDDSSKSSEVTNSGPYDGDPSPLEFFTVCALLEFCTQLSIQVFTKVRNKMSTLVGRARFDQQPYTFSGFHGTARLHARHRFTTFNSQIEAYSRRNEPVFEEYNFFAALHREDQPERIHIMKIFCDDLPNMLNNNIIRSSVALTITTLSVPRNIFGLEFYGTESGVVCKNDEKLAIFVRSHHSSSYAAIPAPDDKSDEKNEELKSEQELPDDELWLLDDQVAAWPIQTVQDHAPEEIFFSKQNPKAERVPAIFSSVEFPCPQNIDLSTLQISGELDPEDHDNCLTVLQLPRKDTTLFAVSGCRGVAAVRSTPNILALYDCEDVDDDDEDMEEDDDEDMIPEVDIEI
eukprot:CAMPEP_0197323728 /NCGR_PEP_ID=MMETSP0891-20130614/70697_1 /TAXON_ID=44058 ORGANISM="Aureoumbra lagunensis, Strain CCMP1510" /NCGR_SAMPLE_ID=MMETSP0891 /ASSEMBLY_ACC=CAM_ASM_000534 /LENGTH=684 /DNA_ID=CAMNT_0042816435 /DNA_START=666 /DNA_END=2720 /DNA_ORIENTATION=+